MSSPPRWNLPDRCTAHGEAVGTFGGARSWSGGMRMEIMHGHEANPGYLFGISVDPGTSE